MAHLLILCEGDLEKQVLESFLRPYWRQRFSRAEIQQYSGAGDLKRNFKADAETWLRFEPDAAVLCLVDLYEEPFGLYQSGTMSVNEGYRVLHEHLYKTIRERFHPRFGGFPVVMEPETWLLAAPAVQRYLDLGEIGAPEQIKHPAGYLENIYETRRQKYGKIQSGVDLFSRASAEQVYQDNCPHFNVIADWLITPPAAPTRQRDPAIQARKDAWEKRGEALYARFLELERNARTDAELEAAIQAENTFNAFMMTNPDEFMG